MKIEKFNENNTNKKFFTCMIVEYDSVQYSAVFDTVNDQDNWILNFINDRLSDSHFDNYSDIEGIYNSNNKPVFIHVVDALNWAQEQKNLEIYYDSESLYRTDVKLENNVEFIRSQNKYNL